MSSGVLTLCSGLGRTRLGGASPRCVYLAGWHLHAAAEMAREMIQQGHESLSHQTHPEIE